MNTLILIPAYNPPAMVVELVDLLIKENQKNILIIDDGSNQPILESQFNYKVEIIRNETNMGKGYTLLKGFQLASHRGLSYVVVIDADMQHDPTMISKLINADKKFDFVIAKRSFKSPMPFHRMLSNTITSKMVSFLCGQRIFDSQCGYRRYKLNTVLNHEYIEYGYQFESEVLIKSVNQSSEILHIDTKTIYNESESSIRTFSDTIKFIKLILRSYWQRKQ